MSQPTAYPISRLSSHCYMSRKCKPILKSIPKQKYESSQEGMRLKMGIKEQHPDYFLLLSKKLQEGGQRSEVRCKMSSSVSRSHLKGHEGESEDASHQES